jgi:hypothetical protein
MPLNSTRGGASAKGFGFTAGGGALIVATGGTITEDGNFKIHTFTGPGTFSVSKVSSPVATVDYLVVAGGGSGGTGNSGGGGGAGGTRFYLNTVNSPAPGSPGLPINNYPSGTAVTITATDFPITVGGGGAGAPPNPCAGQTGNPGNNSIFSTITSAGGGGGNTRANPQPSPLSGGSGGGGGAGSPGCPTHGPGGGGGIGNTPPVSPSQGNPGGQGSTDSPDGSYGSGGGGGAIGSGQSSNTNIQPTTALRSTGGDGIGITTVFGSNGQPSGGFRYYGGGGGGYRCGPVPAPTYIPGGLGGSGVGQVNPQPLPPLALRTATDNTGGGGGGNNIGSAAGANGGSGIVVIRYQFK